MSGHKVSVVWQRDGADFQLETYNRDHQWQFEGGENVAASAAPSYKGNAAMVDPEQAFTASLSSCHMLTFLAIAAGKGLVVNRYSDEAEGLLGKNEQGRMAVTRVILRPQIEFEGRSPSAEELEQLHHRAHKNCFIANSVTTQVDIES